MRNSLAEIKSPLERQKRGQSASLFLFPICDGGMVHPIRINQGYTSLFRFLEPPAGTADDHLPHYRRCAPTDQILGSADQKAGLSFDFLVKLLDAQVACLDIGGLSREMLTARRAAHGLIDPGTAVAAIDKDRSAKPFPKGLKYMLTKEAEVVNDGRTWVKLLVIAQSGGSLRAEEFPEREVFGKLHSCELKV